MKQKSRRWKRIISSMILVLLVIASVFSFPSLYVSAESDVFTDTESLETGENFSPDVQLEGELSGEPESGQPESQIPGSGQPESEIPENVLPEGEVPESELPGNGQPEGEVPEEMIPEALTDGTTGELTDGAGQETQEEGNLTIEYDDKSKIHYINDPLEGKITLFCMNNKLWWPHHTENMGNMHVPNYTEGYLTPNHFETYEEYKECMRRLSKLLYAGYPYNGERLYQIVEDSSGYAPTEAEFNEMLIVPPVLQTAFPYLGHHDFKYADWRTQNKEHLEYIRKFTEEVVKLWSNGGTTSNGLTYKDISSMPFYKAAFSITNCHNQTPLETFQFYYGADYFVTEEEAYNATQNAVWHLLCNYGIPDNDIHEDPTKLSQVLYTYSERGGLLTHAPSADEIYISGDLTFTYNPKDGMWHSGKLRVIEPDIFRGLYRLDLPKGITAQCDNLNYVYGNEEYELVSDHQPTLGEQFIINAEFVWLKEFRQYSPSPDIPFEGKKFQHMIGAIIKKQTVRIAVPMDSKNVGNVEITKTVIGEENCQKEFEFELQLLNQKINGFYGDLEFHDGIASFTLKNGETKKAENLPAGATCSVEELNGTGYKTEKIVTPNQTQIPVSDTLYINFKNTKLYNLSLDKKVTGDFGDKTKKFNFTIQLKDGAGKPVTGKYPFSGYATEDGIAEPAGDELTFDKEGKTTLQLSHGQKITINDIPYGVSYTITEQKEKGYNTTYSGKNQTGTIQTDTSVSVVNHMEYVPPTGIGDTDTRAAGGVAAVSAGAMLLLLTVSLFRRRRG